MASKTGDDGTSSPPEGAGTGGVATVLCMNWGAKYSPEYVNRLYGMVARQLWQPVRFLCLTDNPDGIRADVACHPIPDLPLPSGLGSWRKLAAFSPKVAGLLGETAIFLDLDLVIVGALEPFFEQSGEFLIIRDWRRPLTRAGNASVFRFSPQRSTDLFDQYCRDAEHITRKFRTVGEYLTRYMADFGALGFWSNGWCASFKQDCIPGWPWRLWQTPTVPEGSRILVFHGEPKPPQALAGGICERGQYCAAPWIAEHWRE